MRFWEIIFYYNCFHSWRYLIHWTWANLLLFYLDSQIWWGWFTTHWVGFYLKVICLLLLLIQLWLSWHNMLFKFAIDFIRVITIVLLNLSQSSMLDFISRPIVAIRTVLVITFNVFITAYHINLYNLILFVLLNIWHFCWLPE